MAVPPDCARLLVGATLGESLIERAATKGWVRVPLMLADGTGSFETWPATDASAWGGGMGIPPSMIHRAALADAPGTRLVLLARMMRADLRAWQKRQDGGGEAGERQEAASGKAKEEPRPRCVVFVEDEEIASTVGTALRDALWGDHAISVLLPSEGADPSLITDKFRRAPAASDGFAAIAVAQSSSVLVAPATSARGLDFANVSHVYALGIGVPSASEYAHMAGRTARIGQLGQSVVTCVLGDGEEVLQLEKVVQGELSRKLMLAANCVDEVESARALQREMDKREAQRGGGPMQVPPLSALSTFDIDADGEGAGGDDAMDDVRRRLEDGLALLDDEDDEGGDEGGD